MNVNTVDLGKMEKVYNVINQVFKSKSVFKALISCLKEMKQCINCSIVTIFLFDTSISDHKWKDLVHIQKMTIEGRWVDRIGINEIELSEPSFTRISHLRNIIRTQEYLAYPLYNRENEIVACL